MLPAYCLGPTPSLVVVRERVIDGAELLPRRRDRIRDRGATDGLGEDDGEASLEVEVDVAVEEPRAGVVGEEADRDVVTDGAVARRDGVAPDGVVVVVLGRTGAAYDCECVLLRAVRVSAWFGCTNEGKDKNLRHASGRGEGHRERLSCP